MRHHLTMQQWVPWPVQTVFDLFADPRNLPPLMPAWQQARLTAVHMVPPPRPAEGRTVTGHEAGAGSRMRIRFRPFPLAPFRLSWDAHIEEFAWDDHFCDVQVRGPFASWRHCHRLRAARLEGREGTIVTDEVTLSFRGGPLGQVAWQLGGERQVRSLFRYRQKQLLRLLRGRA